MLFAGSRRRSGSVKHHEQVLLPCVLIWVKTEFPRLFSAPCEEFDSFNLVFWQRDHY
jgi:hypothetical protein